MKPYINLNDIEQILSIVDEHDAICPEFSEGWHAALSAVRYRLQFDVLNSSDPLKRAACYSELIAVESKLAKSKPKGN